MISKLAIDINCDMGENYGQFKAGGQDNALFPFINSCNIACGFHGGDPLTIQQTIESALQHNLRIGAHPSYPDLAGFGRRNMTIPKAELKAIIKYQVAALKGMVESLGGSLSYVKPHGALYNQMAKNRAEAKTVIEAIQEIDSSLALMGLAGSSLVEISKKMAIEFIAEAFADRRYEVDGKLRSRTLENAILHSPQEVADQVQSILENQIVYSLDGTTVPIHAQSICIHGDNPQALAILKAIRNL
ncbi:MAG: LamB/YcsF family protein [Aureispira sp.]|nr:LamB/YcsF family protein [Aureispira sp.]